MMTTHRLHVIDPLTNANYRIGLYRRPKDNTKRREFCVMLRASAKRTVQFPIMTARRFHMTDPQDSTNEVQMQPDTYKALRDSSDPGQPPRIIAMLWAGETVYGVLDDSDSAEYRMQVITFIPAPSPEHGFGGIELALAPTIVCFAPDEPTITWRELSADEFWSLARAKARG